MTSHSKLIGLWFHYVHHLERWLVQRPSSIGKGPFFNAKDFPWAAMLEAHYEEVRGEVEELMGPLDDLPGFEEIAPDFARSEKGDPLTEDRGWKTFFLYGFGHRIEANCARCPNTAALVERVPGMRTAMFSILHPRKHIPPHRGPYQGLLRYQLGLVVPDQAQACRIRVGDEVAFWEAGRSMIFDDTFVHEVWNDTDDLRAILFLDVLRPLPFPASLGEPVGG